MTWDPETWVAHSLKFRDKITDIQKDECLLILTKNRRYMLGPDGQLYRLHPLKQKVDWSKS